MDGGWNIELMEWEGAGELNQGVLLGDHISCTGC